MLSNTEQPGAPVKRPNRVTRLLAVVMALALGAAVGIGGYTFVYAKGGSYLRDDPRACANCHIMQDHLNGWIKSSHRSVATCNDCHTPHGFIPKYFTKAEHGFFHSLAFTTGEFHEPIEMKARSRSVTEGACRKCHQNIVHDIEALTTPSGLGTRGNSSLQPRGAISCIRCHRAVGHPTR